MSEVEKYAFEIDDDAGMYPVIDSHKKKVVVVCDGKEHARHVCKLLNDERAEAIASTEAKVRELQAIVDRLTNTLQYIADRKDRQSVSVLHLGEVAENRLKAYREAALAAQKEGAK